MGHAWKDIGIVCSSVLFY